MFVVAVASSAGAAVQGTGASTIEDNNEETLDVTPPAGDAAEAETGSTPTTPRSQTGKKTKATVKRKAERRQHTTGCSVFKVRSFLCLLCRLILRAEAAYESSRINRFVLGSSFHPCPEQLLRFCGSARGHSRHGDWKPPGARARATGRWPDAWMRRYDR